MFVEKLRKTQNKVIRIIITDKNGRDIYFPIYQHIKILPVQHLFICFKIFKHFLSEEW